MQPAINNDEYSPPAMADDRKVCGVLLDPEINFRFEVWAYRPLTDAEMTAAYRAWYAGRDKRRKLKNKIIQLVANHGAR